MSNGQLHDDKLFRELHDRLSDYEAPYDGADWDAMSRSLDQLPKTNQFRWKFSLNTIAVVLGIAGLATMGIVWASGKGNAPASSEKENRSAAQNVSAPVMNASQPVVSTNNVTVAPAPNAEISANNNTTINTVQDLSRPKQKQEITNGPLLFGDQIDPAKGFVYKTEEDPALLSAHADVKRPEVYYDNENGEIKKIIIPDDSAGHKPNQVDQDSVQLPVNGPDPAAPTEVQRIGFDN